MERIIGRAIIRFRTELPMTVTGKPQKFLMREAMVEELGCGTEDGLRWFGEM